MGLKFKKGVHKAKYKDSKIRIYQDHDNTIDKVHKFRVVINHTQITGGLSNELLFSQDFNYDMIYHFAQSKLND